MNHVKNQWKDIAKARSQMAQDKSDDCALFTARFDPWLYGFLVTVIAFFVAAFFAIIGGK